MPKQASATRRRRRQLRSPARGFARTRAARTYSVPTQLIIIALVAVLVVPGIAFAGLLLARYAHSERVRYELESVDVARAASTALDRYLNGLQTTLQTLSTSAFLAAGDLEAFHQQAERIKSFIGADIGLRLPDGQQLLNTRLPWGAALPPTPLAVDAQVIATGKPVVSDVFTGIVANRPLVAIILPVSVGGELKYLLHISSETDRFHDVVVSVVPDNWLIGVGDRRGTYVTRSENHSEFTGKPGVPAFLARASAFEGTFVGENAYGEKVLVGYTHMGARQLACRREYQAVGDRGAADGSALCARCIWRADTSDRVDDCVVALALYRTAAGGPSGREPPGRKDAKSDPGRDLAAGIRCRAGRPHRRARAGALA